MMQIVSCKNCGGSSIALDTVCVDVLFSKSYFQCKHCPQTSTKKHNFFFCHENCFHEFILKVAKGEAEFKWKE